jgi:lactoylglutathione lyase
MVSHPAFRPMPTHFNEANMNPATRLIASLALVALSACLAPAHPADASEGDASQVAAPLLFLTKINVADLDRSLAFYTSVLGLQELWRGGPPTAPQVILVSSPRDYEQAHRGLVLVYDSERKGPLVLGDGLNNITFIVPDIRQSTKRIAEAGYEVGPVIGPRKANSSFAKTYYVAFVKDPDGRTVELVQHDR